ncbi:MAG: hypothetical protein EAX96_20480 [Candidatus Lokiarchaeota archaeon]|nr:hypothetical protein [Candidatus Lokiarchaeota archaeon]
MEKIKEFIELRPGEVIKDHFKTQKNLLALPEVQGDYGYLVLTNYRLLFLEQKGAFEFKYVLKHAYDLEKIDEIYTSGKVFKHIELMGRKFYITDAGHLKVKELIQNEMKRLKSSFQEESDPSLQKILIKRQVKVIPVLPQKCPSCGAAITHNTVKWSGPMSATCNYCEGMIYLDEKEI